MFFDHKYCISWDFLNVCVSIFNQFYLYIYWNNTGLNVTFLPFLFQTHISGGFIKFFHWNIFIRWDCHVYNTAVTPFVDSLYSILACVVQLSCIVTRYFLEEMVCNVDMPACEDIAWPYHAAWWILLHGERIRVLDDQFTSVYIQKDIGYVRFFKIYA